MTKHLNLFKWNHQKITSTAHFQFLETTWNIYLIFNDKSDIDIKLNIIDVAV